MAASITHRVTTPDSGNTPNATGAFSFASGDLLVVFVTKEASVPSAMVSGDLTVASVTGVSSFTLISAQGFNSDVDTFGVFVADQKCTGAGAAGVVTLGSGGDAGAGSNISVYTVAGLHASAVGSAAVKQSGVLANQAGGGVPSIDFATSAANTNNGVIGAIGVGDGTPSLTAPSGWTEGSDTGYTTGKAQGIETVFRNSGETNQTIGWQTEVTGGSWAGAILELLVVKVFNDNPVGKVVVSGSAADSTSTSRSRSGQIVVTGSKTTAVRARHWDGSNDDLRVSIGACNLTGDFTVAALVRKNSNAAKVFLDNHAAGGAAGVGLGADASNRLQLLVEGASVVSTSTFTAADGWMLVAVTKSAGTTTPRAHILKLDGGSWVHEAMSGTIADSSSQAGGTVRFGELIGFVFYSEDIAVAAEWNKVLTDDQIAELSSHRNSTDWLVNSAGFPLGLWQFNQADVSTNVVDLTSNGADQSARTETTRIDDGPDGWNYLAAVYNDDVSGTIVLAGSVVETYVPAVGPSYDDNPIGRVILTGSTLDAKVATDSRSGTVVVTGSKADAKIGTETRSGTVVVRGSSAESYTRTFSDVTSGKVILTGSVVESHALAFSDSRGGTIVVSGVKAEAKSAADSPSGVVVITGSRVENFIGPTVYTDTCSGTLVLSGTTTGSRTGTDQRSGAVIASGTLPLFEIKQDTSKPYPQAVLADSPSFYYRMDGSGTSWGDGSDAWPNPFGQNTTGALYPDVSGNGRWARVYSEDGVPWYLSQPDPIVNDSSPAALGPPGIGVITPYESFAQAEIFGNKWHPWVAGPIAFTWEFWINRVGGAKPDPAHSRDTISSTYNGDLGGVPVRISLPWGATDPVDNLDFVVAATTVTWPAVGIGTGTWHHVVLRFNPTDGSVGELPANTAELFIDGVSRGQQAHAGDPSAINSAYFTWGENITSQLGPNSYLDELAAYAGAVLSASRIREHYRIGSGVSNDTVSGTVVLSGISAESKVGTDTPSGVVVLSGSRVETFIGPTNYTDTCSGTLVLAGTVARSTSRSSSPSGIVVLAGIRVESWSKAGIFIDSATGTSVVAGNATESHSVSDTRSGTVVLTGSVVESHALAFSDTRSGTVVVTGNRTESNFRSEPVSGVVVLAGTRTEAYNVAGFASDSPSGAVIAVGTRTESHSESPRPTGTLVITGTRTEAYSHSAARSGTVVVTGTRTEFAGKDYMDDRSGNLIVSGSVSEELRFIETNVGSIYLTGSATESADYVAGLLGQIVITGTTGELFVPSGAAFHYPTGSVVIAGSVEEVHNRWDWVDGERWAGSSDARWGEDVGERWEVDLIV